MLQNAYFLAKIGADTAENEQHFAENLPKIGNYRGRAARWGAPFSGLGDLRELAELLAIVCQIFSIFWRARSLKVFRKES